MPRSALALAALALGAGIGYLLLGRRPRRDPAAQAALEDAVAAVDRELAGNLELTTMFDQTRQAVVLENGEFARNRAVLESELPRVYRGIADLYAALPAAESAMERRGPAGSVTPADRAIIETWEGDARESQRTLRLAVETPPGSVWVRALGALAGWLRRRSSVSRARGGVEVSGARSGGMPAEAASRAGGPGISR